ncbi:MAG: dethiobiotin synthase [Arenimonas sp.]
MASGFYVTGTDTEVGKTLVSAALLHALRESGLRAVGMKPVASGCVLTADGWRNEDALALQAASSAPMPAYPLVNPYALPEATAPQIAAASAGIQVRLAPILAAFEALAANAAALVVEGVGGWMAPFADGFEQAQLASALHLPVILVVGMKLGCLNHARLSERAIAADGLEVAGWIGNLATPELEFGSEYAALLRRTLRSPCLGLLPHGDVREPSRFAAHLRLPAST